MIRLVGLEQFNAVGQWREQEYTEVAVLNQFAKETKLFPIDASGTLPDRTQFNGFFELREALALREADFAKGLVQNLVEFGLGRPCGFSDEELVASILQKTQSAHYTPSALIRELVQSREFHSK